MPYLLHSCCWHRELDLNCQGLTQKDPGLKVMGMAGKQYNRANDDYMMTLVAEIRRQALLTSPTAGKAMLTCKMWKVSSTSLEDCAKLF